MIFCIFNRFNSCFNDFFFRHFKFIVSVQWRSTDKSMYVVQSGIKNSIDNYGVSLYGTYSVTDNFKPRR